MLTPIRRVATSSGVDSLHPMAVMLVSVPWLLVLNKGYEIHVYTMLISIELNLVISPSLITKALATRA